jgi:hypothetical protein
MSKIFELSIGELIVNEAGSTLDIFISLKDTDYEFDYHKFYNADECRYFTTEENVEGAIDAIEESLCELSQPDKNILATVFVASFYPLSSEIVESEE